MRPNWNSGNIANWGRNPQIPGAGVAPLLDSGAYLDGSALIIADLAANSATTADSAALDITGDIDLRLYVALDDYTPAAARYLMGKDNAGSQRGYYLYLNANGTIDLGFSTTGSNDLFATSTSSLTTVVSDGQPIWIRATIDVDNGSSQRVTTFYTSSDGSSWTQLGNTVTQGAAVSIFANTTAFQVGGIVGSVARAPGKYYRAQVLNGIGGTVVFDANFATQTANALAFSESSSNAATVTINTTRYSYGLPGVQFNSSGATDAISNNRVHYQPFMVNAPIYVDGTQFHVTSGPASSANVRTGVYRANQNMQPTGAPVIDAGNTVVGTNVTGTFFTQITPTLLQPGMYLTATNTSIALSYRVQRGGLVLSDVANGTSSIHALLYATQTQGAFPNPGTSWNTRTFDNVSPRHHLFLRWYPAWV